MNLLGIVGQGSVNPANVCDLTFQMSTSVSTVPIVVEMTYQLATSVSTVPIVVEMIYQLAVSE